MNKHANQETLYLIREDAPAIGLISLSLLIVTWSVILAGWVEGVGILTTVALASLAISYLLAISNFLDLFALIYSGFFGVVTVWGLSASTLASGTFRGGMAEVAVRTGIWIEKAVSGGFSNDGLIFLILLASSTWYLGFNAVWNLFRVRRIWYAVVPLGLMLLINVYYYAGDRPLELLLVIFLFVTFVLVAQTYLVDREALWATNGISISPKTRTSVLRIAVAMVALLTVVAWIMPGLSGQNYMQEILSDEGNPFNRVQKDFDRLFASVEGEAAVTSDYYATNSLSLSGPIDLSDDPVMRISAPPLGRYYWRSKTFDSYSGGRWVTSSEARIRSQFGRLRTEEPQPYNLRTNVQQQVEIQMDATSLVYAAPQPTSFASLPIAYEVIFTAPGTDFGTVTKTDAQDVLRAGDIYGATSSISIADETSLRNAGTNYPAWVRDTYLTLPTESITPRTLQLAQSLQQPNPYDTAKTMESYLRNNIQYNEQVEAPPDGVEPVDWVLFEKKEGYCTYYASSMAVMLRSVGIPARLSAGFAQGNFNQFDGVYEIKESDAHVWVEVFFPGYGWVEFEPTASESLIQRPDAAQQSDFSLEPTPTPTLQPTLEPGADETIEQETPVPDELSDGSSSNGGSLNSLRFRIPAFIIGFFMVIMLVPTGILGIWFWFEQRGMAHLSEVSRSYARLNNFAQLAGITPPESATPYERAEILSKRLPQSEPYVSDIVTLYVAEQYSSGLHLDPRRTARKARRTWEKLRHVLIRAVIDRYVLRWAPFNLAGVVKK